MKEEILKNTQIVVLMGGLGTRLGLKNCPKALADVNGHPFFDYQLKLLKAFGFERYVFLVGYQSKKIEEYYGDGSKHDIFIEYSYDGEIQLGTGGALKKAEKLLDDDFILIYGDSFMDIDYRELVYRYKMVKSNKKIGIMTLMRNVSKYDKSNVIYKDHRIVLYDKKNYSEEMEYIDYGAMALNKSILKNIGKEEYYDIADILNLLTKQGLLEAQIVTKRFYEIGNPDSYKEFCEYAKRRFDCKNKAFFFDRDGIINEIVFNENTEQLDSPFKIEDVEYVKGIKKVLSILKEKGFLLFVVTNQPAAAKCKVKLFDIYDLNNDIVTNLERESIVFNAIKVCPHHPIGSVNAPFFLKQNCGCRKPLSGMIKELFEVYNIDTEESYMVGDSYTDIIAGKNAGLKTIFIGNLKCDFCNRLDGNKPTHIFSNIEKLEFFVEKL